MTSPSDVTSRPSRLSGLPRIADAAFDRLGLRRRGARQGAGAVVLERADSGLRALRVSHPDGQPNVTAATSLPGVPVRDALSRLARDGWFDDGRVRVMLGAGQRHAVLMPRPDVEDAELVDAMRWQLADKLPYPGEQAVLDVLTIDDHESRTRQQVMVMAAERSALHALLEPVLRLRGQRIEWVDVLDCAQRNLVEAACGPAACVACVTERDGALLFTVSRGRDLVYSRVIEAVADGRDGEMPIERMGLQLQRAIDTIERRSPESAPVRILVGPSASDASPLRAVAEQCGLPVVPLDWAACADIAPAALEGIEGDPGLLMLLGAALRAVQEETHVG